MNPKITKFLSDNTDITLIGLAWSLFWRLYLVIIGVAVVIGVLTNLSK